MHTLTDSKDRLTQAITSQQHTLNLSLNSHHRQPPVSTLSTSRLPLAQNQQPHNTLRQKLAHIQKQQIELKKIDVANDLIRSRIEEQENLVSGRERFPYGRENVEVSEDVLERYRGNYVEQSRVLDKFREEARRMKKTARPKGQGQKWVQSLRQPEVKSMIEEDLEAKRLREALRQQLQQQRQAMQQQKQQIRSIAQTLSSLSLQLHNNSYTLEKGIRDLRNQQPQPKPRPQVAPLPTHNYKDILDMESVSRRIPVVVYEGKPHDARLYFSDVFRGAERVQATAGMGEVLGVLRENERRLGYLGRYSMGMRE